MRVAVAAAILGSVLVAAPLSHTSQTTRDARTSDSIERPFPQDGRIRMNLSAGEYHISGSPDRRIRLDWSVRDADQLAKVHARADVRERDANITTDGPNNKGLNVAIQVPQQADLYVRLTAGDLRIEGIRGNKDVELHAGDVRIDVGRAEDYHTVDASVWAGEIQAAPFEVFKGGLFRSFDWSGKGSYRLHAHLKAGDLRLYSKANAEPARDASTQRQVFEGATAAPFEPVGSTYAGTGFESACCLH
jgi:hypothetical protein